MKKRREGRMERAMAERSPELRPNEVTIQAIKAARRGELTTVQSVEELFVQLNAE